MGLGLQGKQSYYIQILSSKTKDQQDNASFTYVNHKMVLMVEDRQRKRLIHKYLQSNAMKRRAHEAPDMSTHILMRKFLRKSRDARSFLQTKL